jgi:hypothetical protein
MDHRPSNRDLSLTDLYLIPAIMVHLSGHRFTSDEKVELATITWLTQEGKSSTRPVWQTTSRCGQCSSITGIDGQFGTSKTLTVHRQMRY